MTTGPPFVIVGGGPAAAAAARELGQAGAPVLVCAAEPVSPYDRTVLSKAALTEQGYTPPPLWLDGEEWRSQVELRVNTRVASIDVDQHTVRTSDGDNITFRSLLLATGAEPRRLSLPGAGESRHDGGVHYLRDARDAGEFSAELARSEQLVVIGGGVIGLEVAASASTLGLNVNVIEAAPRVLGRGVPEPVAAWLVDLHQRHGVAIQSGVSPAEISRDDNRVTGVRLSDGQLLPADLVVIGVGVMPRDDLARRAGLVMDDGIVVDTHGRTSTPDVFAAGDVVRMTTSSQDRGVRLEAFHAAGRQGQVAARTMLGLEDAFLDVPSSWSDQYDAMMQSVGLASPCQHTLLCGTQDAVLVLSFETGRLIAACGVAKGTVIARPVRAAQLAIAAKNQIDIAALAEVRGDLAALTKVLRSAARGS